MANDGPFYKETKDGKEWFELDDKTERIHGTEEFDDVSPHDHEVVDAPEDMTPAGPSGNDHNEFHNAKLSPDGYFKGFFHQDAFGKFNHNSEYGMAQRQRHHQLRRVVPTSYQTLMDDRSYVSYEHENDTDDLPSGMDPIMVVDRTIHPREEAEYNHILSEQKKDMENYSNVQIRYDHENDTDDIPDGQDPLMVQNTQKVNTDESILNKQSADYEQMIEDYNSVQLQYDHENDTDDIPAGQEPWEHHMPPPQFSQMTQDEQKKAHMAKFVEYGLDPIDSVDYTGTGKVKRRRETGTKFLNEAEQESKKEDDLMQQQADEVQKIMDSQAIQTDSTIRMRGLPHENDTDDIALTETPMNFNVKHSKKWNDEVNKQAVELENEMKIQENIKIKEARQKQEQIEKAALERAEKKAQIERQKKMQMSQKKSQVTKKSHQTIDLGEIYKGIEMVQLGYENHSQYYNSLVEKREQQIAEEMAKMELEEQNQANSRVQPESNRVEVVQRSSPASKKVEMVEVHHHKNPSVNFNEMYEGLVQLKYNHEEDPQDVVADEDPIYAEKKVEEKKESDLIDFTGSKYTEVYDE